MREWSQPFQAPRLQMMLWSFQPVKGVSRVI